MNKMEFERFQIVSNESLTVDESTSKSSHCVMHNGNYSCESSFHVNCN